MRSQPFLRILPVFCLLTGNGQAQNPPAQNPAPALATDEQNQSHAKALEKLYPAASFKTLSDDAAPYQQYQQAVNDAFRSGVPTSILNEFVAMRAMRRADANALRQILPALKADQAKFRPETSMFPDQRSAAYVIQVIEMALAGEERQPGTLAKKAKYAAEMALARRIKAQMGEVDALVDIQAIEKNLQPGALVPEAQWRSRSKPGTLFAAADKDELGNSFGPQVVDKRPSVPKATYDRLRSVVPDDFWAPFGVPK